MAFLGGYDTLYSYEFLFADIFERSNIEDKSSLMQVSHSFNKLFLLVENVKIKQLENALAIISEFLRSSNCDIITVKNIKLGESLAEIDNTCALVMSSLSGVFLSLTVVERKNIKDLLPNNYIRNLYISCTHMHDVYYDEIDSFCEEVSNDLLRRNFNVLDEINKIRQEITSRECDSIQYYQAIEKFSRFSKLIKKSPFTKILRISNLWLPNTCSDDRYIIYVDETFSRREHKYEIWHFSPVYLANCGFLRFAIQNLHRMKHDYHFFKEIGFILRNLLRQGDLYCTKKLIDLFLKKRKSVIHFLIESSLMNV